MSPWEKTVILMTEEESAAAVDEEMALAAARSAFVAAMSAQTFPVVIARGSGQGESFSLKSGSSAELVGVKIGSYWPQADAYDLPRHASTVILLNQDTGRVAAVVETATANAYRTAAADALAVQTLARADARVLAVFGTGHQALFEVRAVVRVCAIDRVMVVGRRQDVAATMAQRLNNELGITCEATDPRTACTVADIIVTATTATEPLFDADWVRPGTHLSAMGADQQGKHELPTALYGRSRLFCDLPEQSLRIGEFQHTPPGAEPTALGAVLVDPSRGRAHAEEITIFDSSGTAMQDLALAAALLQRRAA
jgi:ornithine cyclodeaminase